MDIIKEEGYESQGVGLDMTEGSVGQSCRMDNTGPAGNGIKVLLIEDMPQPLGMYAVNKYDTPYGAAVTASHNAYDYNGIKIFTRGGRDADEELTNRIEDQIARIDLNDVNTIDFFVGIAKGLIEIIDPFNDYIDSIISILDIETISKMRLKVLLIHVWCIQDKP